MDNNRRFQFGGFGLYIALFLLLLGVFWIVEHFASRDTSYNYRQYVEDLAAGKVLSVTITQNQETPTGVVSVVLSDSTSKRFYVVNTESAWEAAYLYGLDPYIKDVSRPSVFLTTILPYVLMFVLFFIMMSSLSAQSGGNNSKMMNFGRSKARMILNNDGQGTTF